MMPEALDSPWLNTEMCIRDRRETVRRGPFRFSQCHIPVGSEIVFVEDPSIRPIVVDDRHIEYNGETTSVSALAQLLKGFNHPVQGTLWFTYQGERLTDLRDRLEAAQDVYKRQAICTSPGPWASPTRWCSRPRAGPPLSLIHI